MSRGINKVFLILILKKTKVLVENKNMLHDIYETGSFEHEPTVGVCERCFMNMVIISAHKVKSGLTLARLASEIRVGPSQRCSDSLFSYCFIERYNYF